MIKSITFTGKSGYITEKIPEPECHVRGYGLKGYSGMDFTDAEKDAIKKYKKERRYWEKHQKDSYAHPQLVNNLIGRKIEFKPCKINLIFGPNASGKTTILKAIAGKGGTVDGYPSLVSPIDLKCGLFDKLTYKHMTKYITNMMKNSADVEWDGAPIYYDNFANRKTTGRIGDLCGSVLGNDIMSEIQYIIGKDTISLGQNTIYLMNKLFTIAKEHLCYADIFKQYVNPDGTYKKFGCNDTWADAYKIQLSYFLSHEKSLVKSPSTFLFDELDKSLDIANIYALYTEVLPLLVKETGIQVIIISHSPLVLSDKIRNSEMYNLISTDEQYTKDCLDHIGKLFKYN